MVFIYGEGNFEAYKKALLAVGLDSVISTRQEDAENCDSLLLPGGGDIKDALDREETDLIEYYIRKYRPVLGICRGMQALNVYFGGTLYDFIAGHQKPGEDIRHPTRAAPPLSEYLGQMPVVNSNHHQAVKRLGYGLRICQWAPDGVAEAIVHTEYPVLGVQWHPERMGEQGQRIFALWREWINT